MYKEVVIMRIGIIGHFAIDKNLTDGQTVKTRNIYYELKNIYGEEKLYIVDSYNWKSNPIKLFIKCIKSIMICDNVLVLPARNGIKVFIPFFAILNRIFNKKIFYIVVGGWLPEFLSQNLKLIKYLNVYNKILVEVYGIKDKLTQFGLKNVEILYNFKNITVIKESELSYDRKTTLKVCTFSRVIKEKGIENAINAVNIANKQLGKKAYQLDIYGPIELTYKDDIQRIIEENSKIVKYKGVVNPQKSVNILKKYDYLLFPTYYDGEGFAGTIVDAFSSGVPVIASDWKYNSNVITNRKTGFIFKTKDDEELANILCDIYNSKYNVMDMKRNCIREAVKYTSNVAIQELIKYF